MFQNSHKIFLSPIFLLGLFLLLLNDFYLKAQFGNFLTGKLSDFAGLFVFPLFFAAFLSNRKVLVYIFTGILFVIWKSPYTQGLIDFWNSFEIFRIGRTIDFTDLLALVVLPISYFYLNNLIQKEVYFSKIRVKQIVSIIIIFVSVFAFTATSYEQDRNVSVNKKYELDMDVKEFEFRVRNIKSFYVHSFEKQTDVYPSNIYPDLKTDPSLYYLSFDLQTGYCESPKLRIFIGFNVKEEKIIIDKPTFSYWCEQPPNEKDQQELTYIFEREVIEKLRQNSSQ